MVLEVIFDAEGVIILERPQNAFTSTLRIDADLKFRLFDEVNFPRNHSVLCICRSISAKP